MNRILTSVATSIAFVLLAHTAFGQATGQSFTAPSGISSTGTAIIQPAVSGESIVKAPLDIPDFGDKVAVARVIKNGKYGLVNHKGKTIRSCEYDFMGEFSEGLAVVMSRGKYGFVDARGREVIPAVYNAASPFSEGKAFVTKGSKQYFINQKNQRALKIKDPGLGFAEEFGGQFKNGFCVMMQYQDTKSAMGLIGAIDEKGKTVVPFEYEFPMEYMGPFPRHFSGGILITHQNGKWGAVDENGKVIIKHKYADISDFEFGVAFIQEDEEIGGIFIESDIDGKRNYWIDKRKKRIIPTNKYDYVSPVIYDGLIEVKKEGKYGFINATGEEVIPCIYDWSLGFFSNGTTAVVKEGKLGYINTDGEIVIPFRFDYDFNCPILAGSFLDDWTTLALVADCDKWELKFIIANLDGTTREIEAVDFVSTVSGGVALVISGERRGMLHKNGTIIWLDRFDEVYDFQFVE